MSRDPWVMRALLLLLIGVLAGGYYIVTNWQRQVEALTTAMQSLQTQTSDLQDRVSKIEVRLNRRFMDSEGS